MSTDELDDFFLEGGDELMNVQDCPHCGEVIYLDKPLAWIDKASRICECPNCGGEVEVL